MPTAPEGRGQRPRVAPPTPGNEPTTAIPTPRSQPTETARDPEPTQDPDATTAIPTPGKQGDDAEAATEKLNTREDDERQRRGGVSAQDLLRREGRL